MAQINSMENYLGQHPYVGAAISLIHFVIGYSMKPLAIVPSEAVMKWLQAGAFSIGMIAGLMTIYGVWKTHHGKKGKK